MIADIRQEKLLVLNNAIEALRRVPNVVALVLGGSHARGLATASSDIDIGVYYRESAPLAVEDIRAAANAICTPGSAPVVTDLYGWGPWVNGGAWIQTPVTKVDLVYRNLNQVHGVIDEGQNGIWRHDYDQQPPYGFRSVVYFGETRYCVPLHDPDGEIERLKATVTVYPEPLKNRILHESLWGMEFSLWSCDGFAAAGDVYNAAGCMTRAAQFLVHALFAINEEYFLNDKHVRRVLPTFAKCPLDCAARLDGILSRPADSLPAMRELLREAVALTNGAYTPRFDLTAARVE